MNWNKDKSITQTNEVTSQNQTLQLYEQLPSLSSNRSRFNNNDSQSVTFSTMFRPKTINLKTNASTTKKIFYHNNEEEQKNFSPINTEGGPIPLENMSIRQRSFHAEQDDEEEDNEGDGDIDQEFLTSSMWMSPGRHEKAVRIQDLAKFKNTIERNNGSIYENSITGLNDSMNSGGIGGNCQCNEGMNETRTNLDVNMYNLITLPGSRETENVPMTHKGFNKNKAQGNILKYEENVYRPSEDKYKIHLSMYNEEEKPMKLSQLINKANAINQAQQSTKPREVIEERKVRFKPYDQRKVAQQINAFHSIRARSQEKPTENDSLNGSSDHSEDFPPERSPQDKFRCISLAMLKSKGPTCEDRKWNRIKRNERGGVCDFYDPLTENKPIKYKIANKPTKQCIHFDLYPKVKDVSCRIVQKWWRKTKEDRKSRDAPATVIQSNWRGYSSRKNTKNIIMVSLYYQGFCDLINEAMKHYAKRTIFNKLFNRRLIIQKALWRLVDEDSYFKKSILNKWRIQTNKVTNRQIHLLRVVFTKDSNVDDILIKERYFNRWRMMIDMDKIIKKNITINNREQNSKLKGTNKLIDALARGGKRNSLYKSKEPLTNYLMTIIRKRQEKALDSLGKKNDKKLLQKYFWKWRDNDKSNALKRFKIFKILLLSRVSRHSEQKTTIYFLRKYFNKWRFNAKKLKNNAIANIAKGTKPLKRAIQKNTYNNVMPVLRRNYMTLFLKNWDDHSKLKYYIRLWRINTQKLNDKDRRALLLVKRLKQNDLLNNKDNLYKYFYRWRIQKPADQTQLKVTVLRSLSKNKTDKEKNNDKDLLRRYYLIWKHATIDDKNKKLRATPRIVRSISKANTTLNGLDLIDQLSTSRKKTTLLRATKLANKNKDIKALNDSANKWRLIALKLKDKESKIDNLLRTRSLHNEIRETNMRYWLLRWNTKAYNIKNKEEHLKILGQMLKPTIKKLDQKNLKRCLDKWRNANRLLKEKNKGMRMMIKLYGQKDNDMRKYCFCKWRLINHILNKVTKGTQLLKNHCYRPFYEKLCNIKKTENLRNKILFYIRRNKKDILRNYLSKWRNNRIIFIKELTKKKFLRVIVNKNEKLNLSFLLRKPFNTWRRNSMLINKFRNHVNITHGTKRLEKTINRRKFMNCLENNAYKMNSLKRQIQLMTKVNEKNLLREKFNFWRNRANAMNDINKLGDKAADQLKCRNVKQLTKVMPEIHEYYNQKSEPIRKFCLGMLKIPNTIKVMKKQLLLRRLLNKVKATNQPTINKYFTLWRKNILKYDIKKRAKKIQRYLRDCYHAKKDNNRLKHLLPLIRNKDDKIIKSTRPYFMKWRDNTENMKDLEKRNNNKITILHRRVKNSRHTNNKKELLKYLTLWRNNVKDDKMDKEAKIVQKYMKTCLLAKVQNNRLKHLLPLIHNKDDKIIKSTRPYFIRWRDNAEKLKDIEEKNNRKHDLLFKRLNALVNNKDGLAKYFNIWKRNVEEEKMNDEAKIVQKYIQECQKSKDNNNRLKHLLVLLHNKDDKIIKSTRPAFLKLRNNSKELLKTKKRIAPIMLKRVKVINMKQVPIKKYFNLWRNKAINDKKDEEIQKIQKYIKDCQLETKKNNQLKHLLPLLAKKENDNKALSKYFLRWKDNVDLLKREDYLKKFINTITLKYLDHKPVIFNKYRKKTNEIVADENAKTIQNYITKSRNRAIPKRKVEQLVKAVNEPMMKTHEDKLFNGLRWIGRIRCFKYLFRKFNELSRETILPIAFHRWRGNSSYDSMIKIRKIQNLIRSFLISLKFKKNCCKKILLRRMIHNLVNNTELTEIIYLKKWHKIAREDSLANNATTINKVSQGRLYRKNNPNLRAKPKEIVIRVKREKITMTRKIMFKPYLRRYLKLWRANTKKRELKLESDFFSLEYFKRDPNENNEVKKLDDIYYKKQSPNERLKSSRVKRNDDFTIMKREIPTMDDTCQYSPRHHSVNKCHDMVIEGLTPKKPIIEQSDSMSYEVRSIAKIRAFLWPSKKLKALKSQNAFLIEKQDKFFTEQDCQSETPENSIYSNEPILVKGKPPKKIAPNEISSNDSINVRGKSPKKIAPNEIDTNDYLFVKGQSPKRIPPNEIDTNDSIFVKGQSPKNIASNETSFSEPVLRSKAPKKARPNKIDTNESIFVKGQSPKRIPPNEISTNDPLYVRGQSPKKVAPNEIDTNAPVFVKGQSPKRIPPNEIDTKDQLFVRGQSPKKIPNEIDTNDYLFVKGQSPKRIPPNEIDTNAPIFVKGQSPKQIPPNEIDTNDQLFVKGQSPKRIPPNEIDTNDRLFVKGQSPKRIPPNEIDTNDQLFVRGQSPKRIPPNEIDSKDHFVIPRLVKEIKDSSSEPAPVMNVIEEKKITITIPKIVKSTKERHCQITPKPPEVKDCDTQSETTSYDQSANLIDNNSTLFISKQIKQVTDEESQKSPEEVRVCSNEKMSLLTQKVKKVFVEKEIQITPKITNKIGKSSPVFIPRIIKETTNSESQSNQPIHKINKRVNDIYIPKIEREIDISIVENNLSFIHSKKVIENEIEPTQKLTYEPFIKPRKFPPLSTKQSTSIKYDGIPKEIPKPEKYIPHKILFALICRNSKKTENIKRNAMDKWFNTARDLDKLEKADMISKFLLNVNKDTKIQNDWFRLSRIGMKDIVTRLIYQRKVIKLEEILGNLRRKRLQDVLDRLKDVAVKKNKLVKLGTVLKKADANVKEQQLDQGTPKIYKVYIYKILKKYFDGILPKYNKKNGQTFMNKLKNMPNKERGIDESRIKNKKNTHNPEVIKMSFNYRQVPKTHKVMAPTERLMPYLEDYLDKLIKKRKQEVLDLLKKLNNEQKLKKLQKFLTRKNVSTIAKYLKKTYTVHRLFYLIRVTELHKKLANRKYLQCIIYMLHIYTRRMKSNREKMRLLHENMELTFMQIAHDVFGNDQTNLGVNDAFNAYMDKQTKSDAHICPEEIKNKMNGFMMLKDVQEAKNKEVKVDQIIGIKGKKEKNYDTNYDTKGKNIEEDEEAK